jgi:DNA polymerase-3 subunit delta
MAEKPIIYILHGDDEFAMDEFITGMVAKMGDSTTAEMNITHLEGKSYTPGSLLSATHSMPFLADRRLVVLTDPLGAMKSPKIRENFKSVLEDIPNTTALVLLVSRPLVSERDKRKGVRHWLQKWGAEQDGRVLIREFALPDERQMAAWIQTKATELGGIFSYQAAGHLAEYVRNDPRLATQEINKLLAYVNFSRPVDPDDVERLTPYSAEGDVFKMVDALGNRNGELALRMLHRLLEGDEPLKLFGMIVRQFRMLLLTREMLDAGYGELEISKRLKTYPFVARKLVGQVRNFTIEALEEIYHKLLNVDKSIKTGQMEGDVALDMLITSLTI